MLYLFLVIYDRINMEMYDMVNKKDSKDIRKNDNRKNSKRDKGKDVYTSKEVITIMLFSLGIGFIMCFECQESLCRDCWSRRRRQGRQG